MSAARHQLRAATLADVEPVAALVREAGFKPRSEAGWRWLFQDNPNHRRDDPPPAIGWVLERGGAVDGYLGNVPLAYVLDGRPVRVATCTSYYVRPSARAESTRLMSAFFRQPGVEIHLTTTANALSGPIYRLFKAAVPEDDSFVEQLVWVADDRAALRDMMVRRSVPPSMAVGLAALASPASRLVRRLSGFAHPPRGTGEAAVLTLRPGEVDSRWDDLWSRVATAPGLRVQRDAAALRWYLSDPDAGSDAIVFAIGDEQGLVGYTAVGRHIPYGGAPQLRLLDLMVRPGGDHAVAPLLRRVLAHGREVGVGFVHSESCGAALAAQLKPMRPHRLRHAHPTHFVKASGHGETAKLASRGIWQATGLDGDTPFCIE